MKKSRLSIFNFDTLVAVRSRTAVAMVAAIFALIGIEGAARLFVADRTAGWDYWTQTAASKYVTYFKLQAQQKTPDILIVGDSSADYGFSTRDFVDELDEPLHVYNLATLGNFALAFDETINDMVLEKGPYPDYLFILFTRGGFELRSALRQTEQSILQSPVIRERHGEASIGHWFVLARLWKSRISLLGQILRHEAPVSEERGYVARYEVSADKVEKPEEQVNLVIDPARFSVLEKTVQKSIALGIQPVIVHPPVHTYEQLRWENQDAYADLVDDLSAKYRVPFWDYSHDTRYDDYMRDVVHLNNEGSQVFSRELANRFRSEFR